MSENMNDVEQIIDNFLEQEYGNVHEPVDVHFKHEKQTGAIVTFTTATTAFLKNPSPVNYNMVITTMLAYQYWTQKAVAHFDMEADF